MIDKIPNARFVERTEDAHLATHVIASDGKQPLKRTPKLMIAMNKTPNIVLLDWLVESAKQGTALPCDKFLVKDKEAEVVYGFRMEDTVKRIKEHLENETALLQGKLVYVCKGVAGNKAPSESEFKCIVEAAGGHWLPGLKDLPSMAQMPKLIIITSSEPKEAVKQVKIKAVVNAIKHGALQRTTSWLFDGMMTQHLSFDEAD
jgi:hypothetical protein